MTVRSQDVKTAEVIPLEKLEEQFKKTQDAIK
jgi:hypothetical protein